MVIKCCGENHNYLLFIDIEFSKNDLVQFAGLLFKRVGVETYQLMRCVNQYVTQKVCYPFMEYTNISTSFLEENGIPLQDAVQFIMEDFIGEDVPLSELNIISHGLKNDRMVLQDNGLNLSYYWEEGKNGPTKKPIDGYCTFSNAKRILGRQSYLKLSDIAEECGYYLHNAHNAYNDVWATVAVYTYLRLQERLNIEAEEEVK